MNSAVKLALAGAMSIASVSGVAMAQTADPMVDSTTTTNSTTMATEDVRIVRLTRLDNNRDPIEHTRLTELSNNSESIAEAQAQISSDPALAKALEAENVQMDNVFHVQKAANGGKVVYVK